MGKCEIRFPRQNDDVTISDWNVNGLASGMTQPKDPLFTERDCNNGCSNDEIDGAVVVRPYVMAKCSVIPIQQQAVQFRFNCLA